MIVLPGAFGFGAMQKFENGQGVNTGGDATLTLKLSSIFGGVQALSLNDLVLTTLWVKMTKGVTLGNSVVELHSDGAGVINWLNLATPPRWFYQNHPANAEWDFTTTVWGRVTTAGGISIGLYVQSAGSDGLLEAYMRSIAIRGSS